MTVGRSDPIEPSAVGLFGKTPAVPPVGNGAVNRIVGYLSLFCLLVILAGSTAYATLSRDQVYRTAADDTKRAARLLAEHAGRVLDGANLAVEQVIAGIAGQPWPVIHDSPVIWARLKAISASVPFIEDIWLNDATGALQMSTTGFPAPPGAAGDRDFFVVHLTGDGGPYVSRLFQGRVVQKQLFVLSRRIEGPDGKMRGVASVTINSAYLSDFVATLDLPPSAAIALVRDEDQAVLVQRRPAAAGPVAASGLITARHRSGDFPLHSQVSMPRQAVAATWRRQMVLPAVAVTAALAALAGLTLLAFRRADHETTTRQALAQEVELRTSELRAANLRLQTLFRELNHRVKNNYQVVASLLNLQASRSTDPAVRESLTESVGRIRAMGLLHDLLYDSARDGPPASDVDVPVFLAGLVRQLSTAYGNTRVAVQVASEPGISVPVTVATPLALIVNEILSNALKHAFPDGRAGSVTIGLVRQDRGLSLSIQDDGCGLPPGVDWRAADGLGLRIVRSLAQQLQATVSMTGRAGCRFELRLPLPSEGG